MLQYLGPLYSVTIFLVTMDGRRKERGEFTHRKMPSFSYLSLIYTEELMLGFSDPVDHVHSRAFHVIRFYESLSVTLRLTQDRWRSCSPVIISPAQERLQTEGMVIGFQLQERPALRQAVGQGFLITPQQFIVPSVRVRANPGLASLSLPPQE